MRVCLWVCKGLLCEASGYQDIYMFLEVGEGDTPRGKTLCSYIFVYGGYPFLRETCRVRRQAHLRMTQ